MREALTAWARARSRRCRSYELEHGSLRTTPRAPSAVTRLPAPPRLICCCARDAPEPFGGKSCYHQEQSAGPDSRQAGRGRRGEQRTPAPGLKCAYFSSGNISAEGKPAFMKEGRRCLTTAAVRVGGGECSTLSCRLSILRYALYSSV